MKEYKNNFLNVFMIDILSFIIKYKNLHYGGYPFTWEHSSSQFTVHSYACILVNRSITSRRIINQSTTNIHNFTVQTNIEISPLTFSETNICGSIVYRRF